MGFQGGGGGGGGGGALRFKRVVIEPGADITEGAGVMSDIAAGLLIGNIAMSVGDVAELLLNVYAFNTVDGNSNFFDWLITLPDTTTTTIRAVAGGNGAGGFVQATGGVYGASRTIVAEFTATQAGIHTFKPQMRRGGGGVLTVPAATGGAPLPNVHRVLVLGQPAA